MKSNKLIRKVHNSIILDCQKAGVTKVEDIKLVALESASRISKMTVAGIKASQAKGQKVL